MPRWPIRSGETDAGAVAAEIPKVLIDGQATARRIEIKDEESTTSSPGVEHDAPSGAVDGDPVWKFVRSYVDA